MVVVPVTTAPPRRYAHAVNRRATQLAFGTACAAALLGGVVLFATRGEPDVGAAVSAVVRLWFTGGAAGVLWCAAAVGWGVWLLRWTIPSATLVHTSPGPGASSQPQLTFERAALGGAVGAGAMLWVAHLLGVLGVLSGVVGTGVSWAVVVAGSLLLARALRARPGRSAGIGERSRVGSRAMMLACVPALAVLAVAVCVPTGTLWVSEARGYDSLSYHLALPKEWHASGRLWPQENNVYSWLPSYVEAAYLQLAALLTRPDVDGRWITACNAAHAGMLGMSALAAAALARGVARRAGVGEQAAGWVAGACVLVVPWCVVTGSLSYNEMGMLMGLAGACLAATMDGAGEHPWRRGLVIGFLLGAATACKPTAAFMGGPLVLMSVLAWTKRTGASSDKTRGVRTHVLLAAVIGGVLASLPWLVRNAVACGNPVFPSLASIFGSAHWDAGQIERWNAAHHASGTLFDRVNLLFSDRGALHPQWSAFFALAAAGAAVCGGHHVLRRSTWPLWLGLLLQLIAWMTIGHQQSRFLVPCVLTGAVMVGVATGLASCAFKPAWRHAGTIVAVLGIGWMSFDSARLFWHENGGAPCRALVGGVPAITGAVLGKDAMLDQVEPTERVRYFEESNNPVAATNRLIGLEIRSRNSWEPSPLVYLLGDATPTYFTVPVLWNTVWDTWPLEAAKLERGENPHDWAAALRYRGVTHVLINFSEVERFHASGYSPPEMTPERVRGFAAILQPVATWPRLGVGLYRLGD